MGHIFRHKIICFAICSDSKQKDVDGDGDYWMGVREPVRESMM